MMNNESGIHKCVFFDRDGVVNRSPGDGYVVRWSDFHLNPGFVEALRVVRRVGYEAVVITNQRCVARGLVSRAVLDEMHLRLVELLDSEYGLKLTDVLYCPHGDADQCECRKPKPGMLIEAAGRHNLDIRASWMVGDGKRDIEAGRAAGCRTIFVGSGADGDGGADHRAGDVDRLADLLERVL